MNKFKILLAMQLKEKLDLSFLHSKKQTLFKVVFSLLGFIVVAVVSYGLFFVSQLLHLFSSSNIIPIGVVALIIFVIFTFNVISCTIGLSKSLFYANDNQVLITLPVSVNQIYLSKMLVFYINEIKKSFSFIIPILFAYGLITKLSFVFFIWMPVMVILSLAIPVLIGGILAIPTMFIIAFFKKFQLIKIVILILVLGGIITGVVFLINLIPGDIDLLSSWILVSKILRNILVWVSVNLSPFYTFAIFICGKVQTLSKVFFTSYSWKVLLIVLGILIVLTGLNYFFSRPIYLKLTSKQFEFKRKTIKIQKYNVPRKKFVSSSLYEAKKVLRDVSNLSNTLLTLIVAPITVLLLNKIYAAINTKLMGDYLTIAFNVLIILLFTLAHNISVSSIYSKDGNSLLIAKTKPTTPLLTLLPRLMYNFVSTTLILITSEICFIVNSNMPKSTGIFMFFALLFIAYSHIIWCADIDFMKPQTNLFKTEGGSVTNPNEVKATILTFAISAVFTVVAVLLMLKTANYLWIKLCFGAILFFILRLWLFKKKVETLYREM